MTGGSELVDPLLDRIAERRALLAEQAERLRKELAEAEAELERVSSAEQVVTQLLAEAGQPGDEAGDRDSGVPGDRDGGRRPSLVVPHRTGGAGAAAILDDLPADYRRVMQIVAEEGQDSPVACKRVTAKLGLAAEPRHTEGVRVKLKRLAARGWLAEAAPGRFTVRQ